MYIKLYLILTTQIRKQLGESLVLANCHSLSNSHVTLVLFNCYTCATTFGKCADLLYSLILIERKNNAAFKMKIV